MKSIRDAEDNLDAHLCFLKDDGEVIPEASSFDPEDYSGKILLRVSKTLHRDLVMKSKKEGVSLNQLLNELISEQLGRKKQSDELSDSISRLEELIDKL